MHNSGDELVLSLSSGFDELQNTVELRLSGGGFGMTPTSYMRFIITFDASTTIVADDKDFVKCEMMVGVNNEV